MERSQDKSLTAHTSHSVGPEFWTQTDGWCQSCYKGLPFGRKATKAKADHAPPKVVKVQPSQILLPDGIFQQADGQPLSQLPVTQVGHNKAGVVLATIDEALPFFALQAPISPAGVALIVLDHQDARIPPSSELIKFPAQFRATDEPILLTGAMLQIGQVQVVRSLPDSPTKIEEVPTKALRILVYKDELDQPWTDFVTRPVRHLNDHEVFESLSPSDLIDVWDRQFLDQNFKKSNADKAFLYAVNVRVTDATAELLRSRSATNGVYVEPRTESGRQPCPDHSIVWLPKKTLRETVLAAQTTEVPCWVARNGNRYGIRAAKSHAPAVHKLHRPEVDYIEGTTKKIYRLGPMPYGTTKQSLQKVFRQWNWQARAGQPAGQAENGQGVFWSAMASEPPSHWVFTMTHGDVLITCNPGKETL